MHPWPDLKPVLGAIPWAIVGGVATRAYMPERVTHDLDILVRAQDADLVRQRLQASGYTWLAALAIPGFVCRSPEGIEVDVLLGHAPWLDVAFKDLAADPAGYPVLSLPYLVLLKLQASRAQDVADLARMLGQADNALLTEVRAVVNQYAPEEAEDVEALIELGKLEHARPAI